MQIKILIETTVLSTVMIANQNFNWNYSNVSTIGTLRLIRYMYSHFCTSNNLIGEVKYSTNKCTVKVYKLSGLKH